MIKTLIALPKASKQTLIGLGRPEHQFSIGIPIKELLHERVLITGASGHIGVPLTKLLKQVGVKVTATDINPGPGIVKMDVRNEMEVLRTTAFYDPTLIIFLAAQKHAPAGEVDPIGTADVNFNGCWNVLNQGKRVLYASTCKAADPETAYGASKLISERAVLNYGGSVVRYYNVPECGGGNVLDIWREIPQDQPLPVTPSKRYMITLGEALAATLWATYLPSGRYTVDPGEIISLNDFASRLYPNREQVEIPLRRGDRLNEPRHAGNEFLQQTEIPFIEQIYSPADKVFE